MSEFFEPSSCRSKVHRFVVSYKDIIDRPSAGRYARMSPRMVVDKINHALDAWSELPLSGNRETDKDIIADMVKKQGHNVDPVFFKWLEPYVYEVLFSLQEDDGYWLMRESYATPSGRHDVVIHMQIMRMC